MAGILDTPTSSASTPLAYTISAGAGNRSLIVGVTQEGTTLGAPTCTYGGQSMSNIIDIEINPGTTSQRVTIFWCNDATIEAASGNSIAVSNAVTTISINAASYDETVQTAPTNTDSDSSTAATPNPLANCDITTVAANAIVVAQAGMGNDGTAAWAAPLTERTEQSMATTATGSLADDEVATATTVACECTWTTQNRAVICAVGLEHAAAVGISSIDPTTFDMDNADVDINGSDFEASQGTGTVYISDADTLAGSVNEVEIANGINTWSDTVVNLDLTGLNATELSNLHTLGPGTRYVILVNNSSDEYGSAAITLHRPQAFQMVLGAATPGTTTQRLTGMTGTFGGGRIEETAAQNPSTTTTDVASDGNREDVWSIEAKPLAREVQYDFRVLYGGVVPDTITQTPQVTISAGVTVPMDAITLASSAQGLNVNAPVTIPMGTVTLASSVQALNTVAVEQTVLMDPIYADTVVQKMMGPAVEGYVTGYHLAGTAASITRAGSGEVWTYPERALTSETSSSFAFSFIADPEYTDYLRLTDFGFTDSHIPVGSTIRGIELLMERAGVQSNNIQDSVISISLSGSVIGDNQAEVEGWLNTYELKYRPSSGAPTDDWGAGLDQTDVVDSTFGVVVSAEAIGGAGDQNPYIECMWVRIYYAEAQTVALGVATLASSPQGLNVVPGAITVVLGEITLVSSAQASTVVPGIVSPDMQDVTLASSAQALTVSAPPPPQTVSLSAVTLTGSPQTLNSVEALLVISMGAATLASSAQAIQTVDSIALSTDLADMAFSPNDANSVVFYLESGDKYYVVGTQRGSQPRRLNVWKTTSADITDTTNWATPAGWSLYTDQTIYSLDAVIDGTDIYIVSEDYYGRVRYYVFDTTTDTWSTKDYLVSVSENQPSSGDIIATVAVRSDGDVLVGYSFETAVDNFLKVYYSRLESGTWTKDIEYWSHTTNIGRGPSFAIGASDRIHMFTANASQDNVQRTITSDNTLQTPVTRNSGLNAAESSQLLSYVYGGTTYLVWATENSTSNRVHLQTFSSADVPTISKSGQYIWQVSGQIASVVNDLVTVPVVWFFNRTTGSGTVTAWFYRHGDQENLVNTGAVAGTDLVGSRHTATVHNRNGTSGAQVVYIYEHFTNLTTVTLIDVDVPIVMSAATLASSAQALTVSAPGAAQTVTLSAVTLASSAQSLDILVGATSVPMSAATLASSAQTFTLLATGSPQTIPMGAATLASSAQALRTVAVDQIVYLLEASSYLQLPFADANFPTGNWTRRHHPGHEETIDTGQGNPWEDLQGASFYHAVVGDATDYDKSANTNVSGNYSDWLRLTRFGFEAGSIPILSTIAGIEVKMNVRRQGTAGTARSVRLRLAGGQQGDDKATADVFPTGFTVFTYGSSTDDWNAGLDPSDLYTDGFGLDFQVEAAAVSLPHVDWVVIRVWWMWPPVPMSAATLASSAQALTVVATGAPQTIPMSAATLASSAQGLTAIAGAVTVPMGAATLASSAQALTITGAVAVPMSAATLASSAQTLDVIEGAVAVEQSAATLVSSAQSLTPVGGAVTVSLSAVTLASSAQTLVATAPVSGFVYPVTITLASSPQSLTVFRGTVTLSAATLASSAENLTVVPGAVTVSMSAVTLASSTQSARVEVAQIVALGAVTLSSSAQALDVVEGGVTVQLGTVTLASSAQSFSVIPGSVSVSMAAVTLASSPQGLTVQLIQYVFASEATLASSAQALTVVPGAVTVHLSAVTLTAAPQDLRATGINVVPMGAATLASSPQALTVAVAGPTISMGVITLVSSAQSLTAVPGVVYILMAAATLVAAPLNLRYLAPQPAELLLSDYLVSELAIMDKSPTTIAIEHILVAVLTDLIHTEHEPR